jgi:predicted DNA binding CopG/RHH family protein
MTQEQPRKEQQQSNRIPEFKSRAELAEWFDTHDMADYWDELKPVKVRFAKNLSEGINIRLDPETLAQLREEAQAKGIGPTTLARMWILEHLRGRAAQQ